MFAYVLRGLYPQISLNTNHFCFTRRLCSFAAPSSQAVFLRLQACSPCFVERYSEQEKGVTNAEQVEEKEKFLGGDYFTAMVQSVSNRTGVSLTEGE